MPTATEPHARTRSPSTWMVFALWSVPALLSTLETVMFSRMNGQPITPIRAFVGEAPQWYGWALLAPLIAHLGERFPLRVPFRTASIVVHAAASLLASAMVAFADALVNAWVRPSPIPLLLSTRNWFLAHCRRRPSPTQSSLE